MEPFSNVFDSLGSKAWEMTIFFIIWEARQEKYVLFHLFSFLLFFRRQLLKNWHPWRKIRSGQFFILKSTCWREKGTFLFVDFGHHGPLTIIPQKPYKTHRTLAPFPSNFYHSKQNPTGILIEKINGRLDFEDHGIFFCHIGCLWSLQSSLHHLVETQKPREAIEAARYQRYSLQAHVWWHESFEAVLPGGTVQAHDPQPFYCTSCHSILPPNVSKLW